MTEAALVSMLDSQYDRMPLIMARDHAIFRTEFLAGCLGESKCTSSTRSDGKWSAAVTYVHDWDRDSKDPDAKADWEMLSKLTDFDAKAASTAAAPSTVFYMEPAMRAKLVTWTIRCYKAPEKITMFQQLPHLATVLLCHRPPAEVHSALSFWPAICKTNQLKLTAAGLFFGAPGRLSQGECRPLCLASQRRRVALHVDGLALAIFATVHSYLIEQQIPQRNIDGLLHTTMQLILNQDGDARAVFEDRTAGSSVPSHLRINLIKLASIIRSTIKGEFAHDHIDSLFIAAAKRANCMVDIVYEFEKKFSAIETPSRKRAKRLLPCVAEKTRIWRPRRVRAVSLSQARASLAKHYAFQAIRDLNLFVTTAPSGKRLSIIEIEDTAANSVCTALIRYIPRSSFFIFDFVVANLTTSTLLVLPEEDLSVYHRGSAIRLFAEMRSNAYNAVKSDIEWEFLPLAPMLTGLIACNDRTPLSCRVFVDVVRDWFWFNRLPPLNDEKFSEAAHRTITQSCVRAVDLILSMMSRAPHMHPRVATACIQVMVAILDIDELEVHQGCVDPDRSVAGLNPAILTKARGLFGAQTSSGRFGWVVSGPAAQVKLCKMIEDHCTRFGSDASRDPYVGIIGQTSYRERSAELAPVRRSLGNVLATEFVEYSTTIPGLASKTCNVYTKKRLVMQQSLSAGVDGRTSLRDGLDAEGVHRLFVVLACVEQKLHLDCMPDDQFTAETKQTGRPVLVVANMTGGEEKYTPEDFVAQMIVKEPPYAITRRKNKNAPGMWFCGFYFCAWTVDHDTDGGLNNQYLDLTDRAAFFQWVWTPKLRADQAWVHHGISCFNQRAMAAGSTTGGDYQSDDEMAPEAPTFPAECKVPEVKRVMLVAPETTPAPQTAATAAAAAATEADEKKSATTTAAAAAVSSVAATDDFAEADEKKSATAAAVDEEEEEEDEAGAASPTPSDGGGASPRSAIPPQDLSVWDVLGTGGQSDDDADGGAQESKAAPAAAAAAAAGAGAVSVTEHTHGHSQRRSLSGSRSRSPPGRGSKRRASRSPSRDRDSRSSRRQNRSRSRSAENNKRRRR